MSFTPHSPIYGLRRRLNAVIFAFIFALMGTLLSGCASLSETPPAGFNLTGTWELNPALSDSPALGGIAGQQGRGAQGARPPSQRQGQRQGRGQGRGRGQGGAGRQGSPNGQSAPARSGGRGIGVPILRQDTVVIEQNPESLGMAFKDAPYRDVSWGKRVRRALTITAGWQDDELHINTKGARMPISERYALSEDGSRLTVYVELNGGKDDLVFRRVFERQAPSVESSSDWLDTTES